MNNEQREIVKSYFGKSVVETVNHAGGKIRRDISKYMLDEATASEDKELKHLALYQTVEDYSHTVSSYKRFLHEQVRAGIEALHDLGEFISLSKISEHANGCAITAIPEDTVGIEGSFAEIYKFRKLVDEIPTCNIHDLIPVIRKRMMENNVQHWIDALVSKPDSEHTEKWVEYLTNGIKGFMEVDKEFTYYNTEGKEILKIKDSGTLVGNMYVGKVAVYDCNTDMLEEYSNIHIAVAVAVENLLKVYSIV